MNLFHKMLVAPAVSVLALLLFSLVGHDSLPALLRAIAGSLGVGVFMARAIARRVARASAAARKIAAGDLASEIAGRGGDEIGQLLEALYGMQLKLREVIGEIADSAELV